MRRRSKWTARGATVRAHLKQCTRMCIFTSASRAAGCSAGLTVKCGNNTYQPEVDQVFAGACKPCPANAESPEASDGKDDCKCSPGYFDTNAAVHDVLPTCEPCTVGSSCQARGTTTASLTISPGWYRTSESSVGLRQCPDSSRSDSGCIGTELATELGVGIGEGPCKPCAAAPTQSPCAYVL